MPKPRLPVVLALFTSTCFAGAGSTSVEMAGGYRLFASEPPAYLTDAAYQQALFAETTASADYSYGDLSFRGRIYASWDAEDSDRRYADIREAELFYSSNGVQLSGGVGNFFWGVSETVNIINISNQSDLRVDVDGKDKMGQPFVSAGIELGTSLLKLFHFPTFVELSYPLRPASFIPVRSDTPVYETQDKSSNAVRWTISADFGDLAFTYFEGLRRDPILIPVINPPSSAVNALTPFYANTRFFAAEALYFAGDATLKLELKHGQELEDNYTAFNLGFEYPFYPRVQGVQEWVWITEYLKDTRDNRAESFAQDDLLMGARAVLGSLGDIEFRGVLATDRENDSKYLNVDLSKRINNYLTIDLKVVQFTDVGPDDNRLRLFEREDFAQISLALSF